MHLVQVRETIHLLEAEKHLEWVDPRYLPFLLPHLANKLVADQQMPGPVPCFRLRPRQILAQPRLLT